jgi:hypothetical protein
MSCAQTLQELQFVLDTTQKQRCYMKNLTDAMENPSLCQFLKNDVD